MIKLRPSLEICRQCLGDGVIGAEIGVLGGGHAVSMLRGFPGLEMLHLVDSYGGIDDRDEKFLEMKARFDSEQHRLTWHIMTSLAAAEQCEDETFDFVYIDANHRYSEVAADVRAWYPKVKPGGVLCGHDYFTHGSVVKAVDDWASDNNLWIFSTDPDWWVFKE